MFPLKTLHGWKAKAPGMLDPKTEFKNFLSFS